VGTSSVMVRVISPGDLEYESTSQKTIESRVYSSVKEHDPRFISFDTLSAADGHTHRPPVVSLRHISLYHKMTHIHKCFIKDEYGTIVVTLVILWHLINCVIITTDSGVCHVHTGPPSLIRHNPFSENVAD